MNVLRLARAALAVAALAASGACPAAITCGVTSSGFSTAYDPAAASANVTQTFFTVTCTRALSSDPSTVSYGVSVDNGLYALGQNNRAAFGANRIRYDVFRDAACGTTWKGSQTITDSIAFTGTGTLSKQTTYWGCVSAAQSVAAGVYTDTVTMTLSYGAVPQSTAVAAFSVSIATPATCSLSTPPGSVVVAYTSFGATASGSTQYGVTCTLSLPYTMTLDATSGTVLGLNYTLALSAASATGNGTEQLYTVTGTIAAGQGGSCASGACTATQARTLTLAY